MKMNNLPKKFFIPGPLKKEVIEKLNKITKGRYKGNSPNLLYLNVPNSIDNGYDIWSSEKEKLVKEGFVEITQEQFMKLVDKPKFPKRWVIEQRASQEVCDWFNKRYQSSAFLEGGFRYLKVNEENRKECNFSHGIPPGYTLITVDQWRERYGKEEYISNKNNTTMSEKKIIGYELKERTQAAVSTIAFISKGFISEDLKNWNIIYEDRKVDIFANNEDHIRLVDKLKEHNLFDLLLKPVYEDVAPLLLEIKGSEKSLFIKVASPQSKNITVSFTNHFEERNSSLEIADLAKSLRKLTDFDENVFFGHSVIIETVTIGCFRGVKVEDLKNALKQVVSYTKQ